MLKLAYTWGQRAAEQMYQAEVPLTSTEVVAQPFTPMTTNGATSGAW